MEKIKNEQVQDLIKSNNINEELALQIEEKFAPFIEQMKEWKEKAESLQVTDASQEDEMKRAREGRLMLVKVRTGADKVRQELKADSIAYGRIVQGVYNIIKDGIKPIEKHLQDQEDFVKRQDEIKREAAWLERVPVIESLEGFLPNMDFRNMTDSDFKIITDSAQLSKERAKEAEALAEKERIRHEKEAEERRAAEAEEKKRIEAENERLKAEAVAKEKEIAEQKAIEDAKRKEQEAVAAKEREKMLAEKKLEEDRLKLIAEEAQKKQIEAEAALRKKQQEEAAAEAKRVEEAEALLKAPDKEKLLKYAELIIGTTTPEVKSKDAKIILRQVQGLLSKVETFIKDKTSTL